MAGAILISERLGISLNSSDFDDIIEKIRENFADGALSIRDAIYAPIDEGGMSFVSLTEQGDTALLAFLHAAEAAYEKELQTGRLFSRKALWDALMSALRGGVR